MLPKELLNSTRRLTLQNELSIEGTGLHTGAVVHMKLSPGKIGSGIRITRTDLPGEPSARIGPDTVDAQPRGTFIRIGSAVVYTIEHFLAACCAFRLDDLEVRVDAEELPILDGSARSLAERFLEAGLCEIDADPPDLRIRKAVTVSQGKGTLTVAPAEDFRISYTLQYDNPVIGSQFLELTVTPESLFDLILPARTFCLAEEVEALRAHGLAQGGDLSNAVVVDADRILNEEGLRFEDEAVRHKILDLIGDLYVAGGPIRGHFVALRSGHRHNISLVKAMMEENALVNDNRPIVAPLDIKDIQQIIPHRYPMLLVDRITELEVGKRAIGIKNVTGTEGFFQGHFPGDPILPGVLILEALAQVAGVCILSLPQHRGRIPLFAGMDNVKFRRLIVPGDQISLEVEVDKLRRTMGRVICQAKVDGKIAAEGVIKFTVM